MSKLVPFLLSFMISTLAMAQPVVTKNPVSQQICIDTCGMLSVEVNSSLPVTYQWQQGPSTSIFIDIAGETGSTYTMCPDTLEAPATVYVRCKITDVNNNEVFSSFATVTLDSCAAPIADFTFTFEQANVCFTNTSKHAESIIWNFGNNVIDDSNNDTPCNDYVTPWFYDVTLYAVNDYGSDEITRTIDLVGLQEVNSKFETFPNPVKDVWNIEGRAQIKSITLIDMLGNVVFITNPQSTRARVDMTDMPSGVYQVVVDTDDQRLTQKIVKR